MKLFTFYDFSCFKLKIHINTLLLQIIVMHNDFISALGWVIFSNQKEALVLIFILFESEITFIYKPEITFI